MKRLRSFILASPLLLGACIRDAPAQSTSTTRLTYAETALPSPAIAQVPPSEIQAQAARFERERNRELSALWRRFEAADTELAELRSILPKANPLDRAPLEATIAAAETARANAEHAVHGAMAPSAWPTAKERLAIAIGAFEDAVRGVR